MSLRESAPGIQSPVSAGGRAPDTKSRTPGIDQSAESSILVAGAGNWLLASDRIGPRVLEMAAERYGIGVELCDIGSTALSLLDSLRGQDLLIVIDACVGRGMPGEVFVIEPDLSAIPPRGTSTHQIGPVETLIIAQHLEPDSMPRRTILVLVETGDFGTGDEEEACWRVIEVLDREIELRRRQTGGVRHERQP